MKLLQKLVGHLPAEDRRMVSVATHIEVPIAERIERCAENRRIEEAILREYIQFAVHDDRSREKQLVSCLVTDAVHPLALGSAVLLQLVRLVCNHEVCIVGKQLLFEPPCALVIYDHDLQALGRQVGQVPPLLRRRTLEHGQSIWKVCELLELFFPYTEYGKRRDDQHTIDFSSLIHTARHGDAHYRFASAHFHQQSGASALEALIKYAELVTRKGERFSLMCIRDDL